MQNGTIQINADLQQFIQKFEPSKFKILTRGIEIRGIYDLHGSMLRANAIIDKMGLNLSVSHNAEMLSYKGFEVLSL
ncbi:hypothetical protein [Pedobacter sp. N23S346]|uniref:hypothetical protein n=1 Tax=Pedobacter sp. N23S346 TaxID=3402750 RepID=UPI003AD6B615